MIRPAQIQGEGLDLPLDGELVKLHSIRTYGVQVSLENIICHRLFIQQSWIYINIKQYE